MTWQHGKTTGYRQHACHCEECTRAHADAQQSFRQKRYASRVERSGRLVHLDAPHGTKGGYTNYGCRCVECSRAMKRGAA